MKKNMSPEAYRRKLDWNNRYRRQKLGLDLKDREFAMSLFKASKVKKEMSIFQITETLRKDLKSPLWNLPVVEWSENNWKQFNELKTG